MNGWASSFKFTGDRCAQVHGKPTSCVLPSAGAPSSHWGSPSSHGPAHPSWGGVCGHPVPLPAFPAPCLRLVCFALPVCTLWGICIQVSLPGAAGGWGWGMEHRWWDNGRSEMGLILLLPPQSCRLAPMPAGDTGLGCVGPPGSPWSALSSPGALSPLLLSKPQFLVCNWGDEGHGGMARRACVRRSWGPVPDGGGPGGCPCSCRRTCRPRLHTHEDFRGSLQPGGTWPGGC